MRRQAPPRGACRTSSCTRRIDTQVPSPGEHSSTSPAHPICVETLPLNAPPRNNDVTGGSLHLPSSQYPPQQSAVTVHAALEHAHALFTHSAPQQSASEAHIAPRRHLDVASVLVLLKLNIDIIMMEACLSVTAVNVSGMLATGRLDDEMYPAPWNEVGCCGLVSIFTHPFAVSHICPCPQSALDEQMSTGKMHWPSATHTLPSGHGAVGHVVMLDTTHCPPTQLPEEQFNVSLQAADAVQLPPMQTYPLLQSASGPHCAIV
jgi:hypothetical protein